MIRRARHASRLRAAFVSTAAAPKRGRDLPAALTVTQAASDRIAELMSGKEEQIVGLRLGVKSHGCTGLSYTLNYVDEKPKFDEVVETKGLPVFIDPKALLHVAGQQWILRIPRFRQSLPSP